jgi:hypothetical protein
MTSQTKKWYRLPASSLLTSLVEFTGFSYTCSCSVVRRCSCSTERTDSITSTSTISLSTSTKANEKMRVKLRLPACNKKTKASRIGLSQVEVLVSTVIVGVLMVSSLSTIAASRRSQWMECNEARGIAIADALMAEITNLPMREPTCDCGFGVESGESGGNRMTFDDVDDYNGLVDSPPSSRNGTACAGYSDLSRTVAIDLVTTADWNATSATYVGVYRITVKVLSGTKEVCRIVGYRTSGSSGSGSVVGVNALN